MTRPPSSSGTSVSSSTRVTWMPRSARCAAVPPLATSSTRARTGAGEVIQPVLVVDRHESALDLGGDYRSVKSRPDSGEPPREAVGARRRVGAPGGFRPCRPGGSGRVPGDRWPCVHALVDEVDSDAGLRDAGRRASSIGVRAREGGQERRVDVDRTCSARGTRA